MNKKLSRSLTILRDIVDLYYPAVCLLILLVSFLIGIISRYILKTPQTWTYELSTVCFLNTVVASWPYVQRQGRHIVFDMVYEKQHRKLKLAMRIAGNFLIAFSASALFLATFRYLSDMKSLTTQVLHIPRWLVFSCLAVSLGLSAIRAVIDIIVEIRNEKGGMAKT